MPRHDTVFSLDLDGTLVDSVFTRVAMPYSREKSPMRSTPLDVIHDDAELVMVEPL